MSGDSNELVKLFPAEKVPCIFKAIVDVSTNLYRKSDSELETRISRRLYRLLLSYPTFRDGPLSIYLEPEISHPDPDTDTPGGRIDFIVPSDYGNQAYFAIEAKKLRYFSPGGEFIPNSSEYINNGIMRFVVGQYSPYTQTGAMLGYVFDGDLLKAQSGVSHLVGKKVDDLKMVDCQTLLASDILPIDSIHETYHRLNNRRFTLYHLFIPVLVFSTAH